MVVIFDHGDEDGKSFLRFFFFIPAFTLKNENYVLIQPYPGAVQFEHRHLCGPR